MRIFWIIVLVGVAVFLADSSFAQAGSQMKPGRIAFIDRQGGHSGLYLANDDGSNVQYLVDGDSYPVWSPDGQHIAFTSYRDGDDEIFVVDADGGNFRKLTDNNDEDTLPTWSPDGKHIAFVTTSEEYSKIYVMDADGRHQHRLLYYD